MLKSVIKSIYPYPSSDSCSVPAPSIAFRAGGWLAIAGQLRGKGRDRVGAAEPEENMVRVGGREGGGGGWSGGGDFRAFSIPFATPLLRPHAASSPTPHTHPPTPRGPYA